MCDLPLNVCVIFDIDETLIQFVGGPSYHVWEKTPESMKAKLQYVDNPAKRNCIIFRPHLKEFFDFVHKSDGRVKIGLWTYSEREYAEDIATTLTRYFKLNDLKIKFVCKWGAEDIDDDVPKDLAKFWDEHPKYNKFNTILVDDRAGNLIHNNNRENSIFIEPFAPYGHEKLRVNITRKTFIRSVNDKIFKHIIRILTRVMRDMDGCDEEEIADAFKGESVFQPSKLTRKNISNYYSHAMLEYDKKHPKKSGILSIGNVKSQGNITIKKRTGRPMVGGKTRKSRH